MPNLFVIGSARSGTSIIMHILNSSPDVYMLGEPNLHWNWDNRSFVFHYNKQHSMNGWGPTRSTYLPSSWITLTPREIFKKLESNFSLVGAKIAFPTFSEPHSNAAQINTVDKVLDFHASNFLDASYIHTLRDPLSVLISSKKLFVDCSTNDVLGGWLMSILFHLSAAAIFPRSWFICHHYLNQDLLPRLEEILDTRFEAQGSWFNLNSTSPNIQEENAELKSRSTSDLLLQDGCPWSPSELMRQIQDIYVEIASWIDPFSLRFRSQCAVAGATGDVMHNRIRDIITYLRPSPSQCADRMTSNWSSQGLKIKSEGNDAIMMTSSFEAYSTIDKGKKCVISGPIYASDRMVSFSVQVLCVGVKSVILQIGNRLGHASATFDTVRFSFLRPAYTDLFTFLQARCTPIGKNWFHYELLIAVKDIDIPFSLAIYFADETGESDFWEMV